MRGARALVVLLSAVSSCRSSARAGEGDASAARDAQSPLLVSAPSATAPGAPKPGMVWIPAGLLRAGTPIDQIPRVADEELPGVDVPLGGFYIDVLPYPNEAGAIAATNVSRDDAIRLCDEKKKRLCTELEWERACKGPENRTYEYGDKYDAAPCGTGVSAEQGGKRPTGERLPCASAFGVRDMHGGVWQWTDGPWGRGSSKELGVARGGTGTNGELVARCANAMSRAPSSPSPTIGFRCCAGPKNEAKVELEVKTGRIFDQSARAEESSMPIAALGGITCVGKDKASECALGRAWIWRPMGNVELVLQAGCTGQTVSSHCALVVGIPPKVMAEVDTGREIPEVVTVQGGDRRIRVRGADVHGPFFRELIYSYGRVDVRETH